MGKLNQVIAVVNGKKTQCQKALTEIYKKAQKPELFNGLVKTYSPDDEEGEQLPSEEKRVQHSAKDVITEATDVLTELFDSVATQEYANCDAKADVVVDGVVVLSQVPVSYLLFLEKQLVDVHTLVSSLPVLDPSDEWEFDPNIDLYRTKVVKTNRTKKVPKNHVLAEATKEHPAQVQVFTEDVKVGTWNTTKLSGATSAQDKKTMLNRVKSLQEAVKFAREEANSNEVKNQKVAESVLNFVFKA